LDVLSQIFVSLANPFFVLIHKGNTANLFIGIVNSYQ
jgi:hypothetical protein